MEKRRKVKKWRNEEKLTCRRKKKMKSRKIGNVEMYKSIKIDT